jgi:excisionase family DNA binding protein
MAMGKSITIIPSDSNITTQQAADILNVSRPFVVKMLEKGDIPFNKVGTHRRIKLSDIISYDKMSSEQRSENLDFLAQQAQNLNLGYE